MKEGEEKGIQKSLGRDEANLANYKLRRQIIAHKEKVGQILFKLGQP